MTRPFHEFAELRDLLDALCEETIAPEQVRRLEELVLTHPEAEAYYVQYMALYADLDRHFAVFPGATERSLRDRLGAGSAEGQSEHPAPAAAGGRSSRARLLLWGTLGLSALAAGLLLTLTLGKPPPDGPAPLALEAVDHTVAVLLHAREAEWEETGLPTRAGAALPAGWLRLKSGSAHIEFYSGATVILEGPAEFQLVSRTEGYCARGKLRATVPPQAQGFRIGSPKLDLVDRGTEFGLQVGGGAGTEVHVFQGKVELHDPARRPEEAHRELTTGQGARLDDRGTLRPIKLNPKAFLTAQELAARSLADTERRQREWRAASEALRRDPSLLVYYTFQAESAWSRTLLDQAQGRRAPRDGAVVGCSWVAGRWPGKQGLEFKRVSDRVRLNVPGEFESIAMLAWVRADALPNRNNSLLMSDGWETGGLHWQIGEDGMLILGVQSRPKGRGAHYHAPEGLTPKRFGQWIHLAVVYDRDGGTVTHYIDGQPATETPLYFDVPLRIGDAELGNWNIAAHRNSSPVRYFTGCMDEFLLFARALSAREVEQLYTQGRPPL